MPADRQCGFRRRLDSFFITFAVIEEISLTQKSYKDVAYILEISLTQKSYKDVAYILIN